MPRTYEFQPVADIEGVGPAISNALAELGVETTTDLLRFPVASVHEAVRSHASFEQVQRWRAMAGLMETEGVDGQAAEALVSGETETVGELAGRSLGELRSIFGAAHGSGLIPAVPEDEVLAGMLVDAAVLHHTGSLTGVVVDEFGEPVAQASVGIGLRQVATDEHGRFRLLRIPLGTLAPLRIEAQDFLTLVAEAPPVVRGLSTVQWLAYVLEPAGVRAPQLLSELDGDRLPALRGHPVREIRLDPPVLRSGDLLKLARFMKREPVAELVSRLRAYQDGEFLVHSMRIPIDELPAGAAEGDHFLVVLDELEPADGSAFSVEAHRVLLRWEHDNPPPPHLLSSEERAARFKARMRFVLMNTPGAGGPQEVL